MVEACVILINNENEILLQLRTDNNCWVILGGSMEIGESLVEVAKREVFEETGLTVSSLKLFNVFLVANFIINILMGMKSLML